MARYRQRSGMSRGAKLRRPYEPRRGAEHGAAEQLRPQLEAARLDLRALYRALDRMLLAQDLPIGLRRLQELDADFAEALWVLDQPRGRFNLSAMTADTQVSLSRLAPARAAFLATFDEATRSQIEERARLTRGVLAPTDAYLEIPGRDPDARGGRR
jgi:hypothetical protein